MENQYGERLKALRQSKGMTQADLAAALNTTAQVIYTYEKGRDPGSAGLMAYADYFSVTVDYLLGRTEYKDPIEEAGQRLGLTKTAAENLRKITRGKVDGTTNRIIEAPFFSRLVIAVDDYYHVAVVEGEKEETLFDVELQGDDKSYIEPKEARVFTIYRSITNYEISDKALTRVGNTAEDLARDVVRDMKVDHDRNAATNALNIDAGIEAEQAALEKIIDSAEMQSEMDKALEREEFRRSKQNPYENPYDL